MFTAPLQRFGYVHPGELNAKRNNSIVILHSTAEYYVSYQADSSWLCISLRHSEHLPDLHSSTNSLIQVLLIDALQCEGFWGTAASSGLGFGVLLTQL